MAPFFIKFVIDDYTIIYFRITIYCTRHSILLSKEKGFSLSLFFAGYIFFCTWLDRYYFIPQYSTFLK